MKELLILVLMAAAGYLAYDDYYKQRPAPNAQAEIQLRQNPAPITAASPYPVYVPIQRSAAPAWFQKQLDQGSSLDLPRRHTHQGETKMWDK
jgi:hypothetical protein